MGSVRSYHSGQTRIFPTNIYQPLKSRATYATVSNPPLDQKVEMTNWEKVSIEACAYGQPADGRIGPLH